MVDVARARRLAVRIREIVAAALEWEIKDPRLGLVTITDARVTPDLREATVFYTVFGDAAARTESAAALESAKGVLRTTVGQKTGVKHTPSLAFVADEVPDHVREINDLIDQARAADAATAQIRAGATYAGDSQPYRVSDDDEPDESEESDVTESDESVEASAAGSYGATPSAADGDAPSRT